MSKTEDAGKLDRRSFLKGAAAAGAAVAAGGTQIAGAAEATGDGAKAAAIKLPSESFITRPGSDFMVDVLKSIGMQ